MVNKYHKCLKNLRTTKKTFIRKHVKGTKICLSDEEKQKRWKKAQIKNISEENEKKHQYHCDWNKNRSREEKQKKVEYTRNYHLVHKK